MNKLTSYFDAKFAAGYQDTPELLSQATEVRAKYEHVSSCSYLTNFVFPEASLRQYIKKLKLVNCHSIYQPYSPSDLGYCLINSGEGLLIPVLKKHTLNPSEAKTTVL